MNATLHSLLRGYAVIAISSKDRARKCWKPLYGPRGDVQEGSDGDADWERVRKMLGILLPRLGLDKVPLVAFGVSSGGALVMSLPFVMPGVLSAIFAQIPANVPTYAPTVYEDERKRNAITAPWPPTHYAVMPKDVPLTTASQRVVETMQKLGMPVTVLDIHPVPMTPLYLVQRCAPEINESTSRAIQETLRKHGYIDKQGYMLHNPRGEAPSWRAILFEHAPEWMVGVRTKAEESPLSAEMNLLYGAHELSSEVITAVYDWFERIQRLAAPGVSAG